MLHIFELKSFTSQVKDPRLLPFRLLLVVQQSCGSAFETSISDMVAAKLTSVTIVVYLAGVSSIYVPHRRLRFPFIGSCVAHFCQVK
jgi:hypothetical protein